MKIGTCHMMHVLPGRTQSQVYEECIERMVAAERLGFWSSWTTEHHFATDPAYRPYGLPEAEFQAYDLASDPLTFLTYVAAKTTRLRLGTGVLVLHYDHPLRIAERAAMLDVLSGGRLELGIGRGSGWREYAAFGVAADGDREKYHEALDIILKAWTGEPFTHTGKHWQFPELAVVPKPVQQPHPPVYMGSSSPESLKLVAQQGFGYCSVAGSWGPVQLGRHRETRELYMQAAADAGKDVSGLLFPHVLLTYCGESDEEAAEVAEEYMAKFTLIVEAHYERQRRGGATIGALSRDASVESIKAMVKEMIGLNIIGGPETCIRKLEAFRQVANLNYLLAFVDFGGIPHDKVMASMERFSRHVMPHFADHLPVPASV